MNVEPALLLIMNSIDRAPDLAGEVVETVLAAQDQSRPTEALLTCLRAHVVTYIFYLFGRIL